MPSQAVETLVVNVNRFRHSSEHPVCLSYSHCVTTPWSNQSYGGNGIAFVPDLLKLPRASPCSRATKGLVTCGHKVTLGTRQFYLTDEGFAEDTLSS